MFEDRHHKNEALERREIENCSHFGLPFCQGSPNGVGVRRSVFLRWPRVDDSHGVLNDCPPSPRACPVLENRVPIHRILQSGDKALLGLLSIRSQQKRQPVQAIGLFVENPAEITAACVLRGAREVLCLRHVHLRSDSCCCLRASCFSTCLMSTPPWENLAPLFIRSKIASSPSWLM